MNGVLVTRERKEMGCGSANCYGVSFWSDGNGLELVVMIEHLRKYAKSHYCTL